MRSSWTEQDGRRSARGTRACGLCLWVGLGALLTIVCVVPVTAPIASAAANPTALSASKHHSRHKHHRRSHRGVPRGFAGSSGGRTITGRGAAGNPFTCSTRYQWCVTPSSQCTWWAYEQRPDIYDYAVAHGVPTGGLAPGGGYWWDAWRWLPNAQRVGIPTGTHPVAGAIVVFPKGYGRSSVGHVAYVQSVNADGSYLVTEHNWNGHPNTTSRQVTPGYPGVAFIYGGPAGDGNSGSNPPTLPPPVVQPPPVISPQPPPSVVPPAPAPGPVSYVHHVVGTCSEGACGLKERSGPGYSNYTQVGVVYDGNEIDIVCQTAGQPVYGLHATSAIWDRLTNGSYVSDYYTDTPNIGTFSPPIPQC